MTTLGSHDHRDTRARQSTNGGLITGVLECLRGGEANSH